MADSPAKDIFTMTKKLRFSSQEPDEQNIRSQEERKKIFILSR